MGRNPRGYSSDLREAEAVKPLSILSAGTGKKTQAPDPSSAELFASTGIKMWRGKTKGREEGKKN